MNLTYDQAVQRLEKIVQDLEEGQALSMDEFVQKAAEAKELITFCKGEILKTEEQLKVLSMSD